VNITLLLTESFESLLKKSIINKNITYIITDNVINYLDEYFLLFNEIIIFDIKLLKNKIITKKWVNKCVFYGTYDIEQKLNYNIDTNSKLIHLLYYGEANYSKLLKLLIILNDILKIRKDIYITILFNEDITNDKIVHYLELLSNNIFLKINLSLEDKIDEINNCDYVIFLENKNVDISIFSLFKKPIITNIKIEYKYVKYYIKTFDILFYLLRHIDKYNILDYYKNNYSVAYLSNSGIPSNISGYTIRTESILENFIDYKNIICFVRPDIKKIANKGIEIYYYDNNIIYIYLNTVNYEEELFEFLNNSSIKFIWAASDYNNGLISANLGKALNLKSIYEVRGLWFLSLKAQNYVNYNQHFYNKYFEMEKYACMTNDYIICENKILKKYCIDNFGIEQDKISVLNNGVNIPYLHEFNITNFNSKKLTFGYIGSIVSYEGLDQIINAINMLPNFNTIFYIIGGGKTTDSINTQKYIRNMISEYKLENKIHFLGQVPHDDIQKYYDLIDIFCLPRIDTEVCNIVAPLKPYEAMMYGKIVLASSVDALADIVTSEYNGILFEKNNIADLCNKIQKIINFEYNLEDIQRNSYDYIKNKSWKSNINSIITLFE
jgi:glycosyltransferase involved in cell wall biosynthesis